MAMNFGTKLTITWPPWKIIARCFYPHPYFRARSIRWCHLNFFPADPRCYGNEFWDKIDYNSAPAKDNCTLFSPTPYFSARVMQWYHVNFSPEDPCCHGNQPFLFKDKIGCRLTRASNAETQLLSWAMEQIPRSTERTERISSIQCFFRKKAKWRDIVWELIVYQTR